MRELHFFYCIEVEGLSSNLLKELVLRRLRVLLFLPRDKSGVIELI